MLSSRKQSNLKQSSRIAFKIKKQNSLKAVWPKLRNPKNVFFQNFKIHIILWYENQFYDQLIDTIYT